MLDGFADDQIVTHSEAARLLRVSRRSVLELVAVGAFPAQGRAGQRRIRIGDLRAFKARQRAGIREISEISEELGYDE
ncbi:MAG: helix-turn-helix domain-containing protein [Chloroflexia bacterium]